MKSFINFLLEGQAEIEKARKDLLALGRLNPVDVAERHRSIFGDKNLPLTDPSHSQILQRAEKRQKTKTLPRAKKVIKNLSQEDRLGVLLSKAPSEPHKGTLWSGPVMQRFMKDTGSKPPELMMDLMHDTVYNLTMRNFNNFFPYPDVKLASEFAHVVTGNNRDDIALMHKKGPAAREQKKKRKGTSHNDAMARAARKLGW